MTDAHLYEARFARLLIGSDLHRRRERLTVVLDNVRN